MSKAHNKNKNISALRRGGGMAGRRQFVDSGNTGEIVGQQWYGVGSLDRQRFVNSGERHDSGGRDGSSIAIRRGSRFFWGRWASSIRGRRRYQVLIKTRDNKIIELITRTHIYFIIQLVGHIVRHC